MSEIKASANTGHETSAAGTPHGPPSPHFSTHSPQVLARVPDLESPHSHPIGKRSSTGRGGRLLNSQFSLGVLVGAGTLLLAVALGLPFLLRKSDTSETQSRDRLSAWEPEHPAPSAPPAPSWQSATEGAPSWQFPPNAHGASQPDMPATSAWNEDSHSSDWAERSQLPSWEGGPEGQSRSTRSDVPAWGEPTSTPAWTGPSEPAPSSSRPQWQVPGESSSDPTWDTPTDFEAANPTLDRMGRNSLPERSADSYGRPTNSWNEPIETPSWRVPEYRTAGQAQPRSAAPAGYESYRAPPDTYQQVQAGTNRPTTIDGYSPSGTPDYRTDYAQDRQDGYRTADTRAGAPLTGRTEYTTGTRRTAPNTGYPPTSDSRYGYPTRTTEPAFQASSASGYGVGAHGDTRYPQPGVARFQGGIEKPTGSSVYDRDRSSVY